MRWGDGTAVIDTILERESTGKLRITDTLLVTATTGTSRIDVYTDAVADGTRSYFRMGASTNFTSDFGTSEIGTIRTNADASGDSSFVIRTSNAGTMGDRLTIDHNGDLTMTGGGNITTTGLGAFGTLTATNTDTATSGNTQGIHGLVTLNPASNYTGNRHGIRGEVTVTSTSNQTSGSVRGLMGITTHSGSGTLNRMDGLIAQAQQQGSAGTLTTGRGAIIQLAFTTADGGTISDAKAVDFVLSSSPGVSGTMTEAIVGDFRAISGEVIGGDNLYIIKLSSTGTWSHTNKYGIFDDTGYGWYNTGTMSANGYSGNITTQTNTNYTALSTDDVILVSTGGTTRTISFAAASTLTGKIYHIKKIDAGAGLVTLDPNSTETIDGDLTPDITAQYESFMMVSDGSNWHVL